VSGAATPLATRPRLVPMRRRHVPQVAALERRVHARPWSAGLFEGELGQPDRHYVTAWSDTVRARHLLGYGGIQLVGPDAHVTILTVDPEVRRRGVGSHLLLALLEAALVAGATGATLEVRAGNVAAQRLYGGFGFAPVGIRPGYYAGAAGDPAEDALIMWAYDVDGPAYRDRLDGLRARLGWAPRRASSEVAG
jgi:[ribosomal protein S18]-alanine N-acetyltransferase